VTTGYNSRVAAENSNPTKIKHMWTHSHFEWLFKTNLILHATTCIGESSSIGESSRAHLSRSVQSQRTTLSFYPAFFRYSAGIPVLGIKIAWIKKRIDEIRNPLFQPQFTFRHSGLWRKLPRAPAPVLLLPAGHPLDGAHPAWQREYN